MNNKKITKSGPQGAPLLFLYKVSIVLLIDFIAIHTPNYRHPQTVWKILLRTEQGGDAPAMTM